MHTYSGNKETQPPQAGATGHGATNPVSILPAHALWTLLEPLTQAVWETSANGQAVMDSPTWRAYTGQTVEKWLEEGWLSAVHPDDRAYSLEQWQEALSRPAPVSIDVRLHSPDGDWQWTNLRAIPVFQPDGSVGKWIGLNLDIHNRKQAEEAHRKNEESLLAAAMGTFVWYVDEDRGEPDAQMLALFGLSTDKTLNLAGALTSMIHPDDSPLYAEAVAQAADPAGNGQLRHDIRVIHSDGTVRWLTIRGKMHFKGMPRRADRLVGSAIDITDRKLAEQALARSEAQFRSLIEEALVATAVYMGPDLVIAIANEPMIRFFGRGPSILGKPVRDVLTAESDQAALALLDQVFTRGKAYEVEGAPALLTIDGQPGTYYFNFSLKPLHDPSGEVYAIMQMAIDVTEQVTTHQRLEESEARYRSLASELEQRIDERTQELRRANLELIRSNDNLQQFAYIASHDLQEPLRKIQSFGDLLKNQYAEVLGEGVGYLERMQTAASRMSALIRDVLNYSRISTGQPTQAPVALTEVIQAVLLDVDLVIQETGAHVELGPLPTVMGDSQQLGQLFQNLLTNALKFHQPGMAPRIAIRSQTLLASQLPPAVKPGRRAAHYYQLEVTDNGIGFDEQYAGRIFQIFQRLHGKNQFAGTGIGLAICEKVAANHGGAITARSQPGQGATFSVFLPV